MRLRQIVTNLVGNAIKFTDTGGVLVTVGRLADTARPLTGDEVAIAITVEDSGIGIAPDALPFLFHEFEQAEAAVRRRLGGTGLGLAISRRLAQAMAGDIFVASEPGKGSTFTAVARLRAGRRPGTPLLRRRCRRAAGMCCSRSTGRSSAARSVLRWRARAFLSRMAPLQAPAT